MMTVSRHPLDRIAVRLLAASLALSIASLVGAVVVLWPDTPSASVPVQQPVSAGTHASAHLIHSQTPEKAPEPLKTSTSAVVPANDRVKMGETPLPQPVEPVEENEVEPPLDFKLFNDEAVVWFDPGRLSRRAQVRVLTRLMLLPQAPTVEALLDGKGIPMLTPPWLSGRVLDNQGQPVRYPYQAAHYAETLLKKARRLDDGWLEVSVPLKPLKMQQRARRWLAPVRQAAEKVAPELVLAIMEVESGFRPDAVSRSGAIGLMQMLPDQAARDVAQRWGRPLSEAELFDGMINLKAGTAYLAALQHDYLAEVADPRSREYLTIAAYNGGIGAVLRLFAATPEAAVARINRLRPEQVYHRLRYQFPRHETRRYLEKVLQAKRRYRQWMNEHAV